METQLTERLEMLLKTKPFEALNEDEKKYVLAIITEAEYRESVVFYQQLSSAVKSENDTLNLSPSTLPQLQQVFQKKHTRHKRFYYRSIAALLILGLGLYIFYYVLNQNQESDYYLSDEEFNKYTQIDYTAYYIKAEEFKINDQVTEELMNMEFTP